MSATPSRPYHAEAAFDPAPGMCIPVAPGVRRILAPNPSPMTWRGTNTYIVGDHDVAVIDPGPDDPRHLSMILRALNGATVSHILVTHAHLDHSPLARKLAAHTGAPVLGFGTATEGRSAVMQHLAAEGLSGGGEGIDHDFTPDHSLQDMDIVTGTGWQIRALHTPGHMANHLAFEYNDMLFTGDLIMGWATSLVSPPDGDLSDFMASCTRLLPLNHNLYLPGHGAPLSKPKHRLSDLISHRENRTSQILTVLKQGPATIPTLTETLYANVSANLHRAAARNVFAHLIDLTTQNRVKALPALSPTATYKIFE